MRTSCISLFYLKPNFRLIKEVCQGNLNNIFLANIFYYSKVNPFQANIPFMEKPFTWLLHSWNIDLKWVKKKELF